MSTFNAGAIKADLALGRTSWTRDLRKTKKEIEDLEKNSVNIMIDADTDNARVQMDNIEALLDDLDNTTYTPKISITSAQTKAELESLEASLEALGTRTYNVTIDADADNALVSLDNIENFLDSYADKTYSANVDVTTRDAHQSILRLEQRLEALSDRTYYVSADADFDNAYVGLSNLEAEMDLLENDPIKISANVDQGAALAKMTYLNKRIKDLNGKSIDLDVDLHDDGEAEARLMALYETAKLVDGTSVDIDVDYDQDTMAGLVGAGGGGGGGGSLGLLKLALYALLILSPVVAAATSSALAAILALAGALAAAAGPALVLAGGLALLISEFKKAKEAGELTPAMQTLSDALDNMKDVLDGVKKAIGDAGFNLMADAINLLSAIMPALTPLFNATAEAMRGVIGGIRDFVESPEFDEMINFFMTVGIDMLVDFMKILGNLTVFFGRLFDAFSPFIYAMMDGLVELTAGWADWADTLETNEAFQKWMDNAMKYGPMVLDMLGSLLAALMSIGEALEPFAGPMLTALTMFFDIIANAPTEVLSAFIAVLAGLWLGFSVVGPLISSVVGGITALAGALGIGVLPLIAIVAAIAAFGYAIYELWQTNEEFREAIISTWEAIMDTVQPIIDDITGYIREHWDEISVWFQEFWENFKEYVAAGLEAVLAIVRRVLDVIGFVWRNFGDDIMNYIGSTIAFVGNTISNLITVVKGVMQIITGIFTGDFGKVKEGIGNIITGIWNQIKNVFGQVKNTITAPFTAAKDFIVEKWNNLITWVGGIKDRLTKKASGMWDGISGAFKSAVNAIINGWNSLEFSIPGYDWPGPGGFGGITIGVPDIPPLAMGGYVTDPTVALIGEGNENEIVAPDSKMNEMADRAARNSMSPENLASAIVAAMGPLLMKMNPITAEDLERLIEAAGVNIDISGMADDSATSLAKALSYELRILGYGGKASA